MGISFAIPIDEAKLIAAQLKRSGKVVRGSCLGQGWYRDTLRLLVSSAGCGYDAW